jgi:CheY-like chemotaxis protein
MDFEMPVMNGPSATARLRELGCACLIVGVTGNVLSQDVEYFKEMGADAVLPKPLILEDFERLLTGSLLRRTETASGDDSDLAANPAVSKKPSPQAAELPTAAVVKVHADQPAQAPT